MTWSQLADPSHSSVLGRGRGEQGGGGEGGRHGYHVGMDSILDQSWQLLTSSATDSHGEREVRSHGEGR